MGSIIDFSHGLKTLRLHIANKKVQEDLRQSEEKLRLKLDTILHPDIDMSQQELGNIIDVEAMQLLMDSFYAITNMATAIVDIKGNVLVGTGWQDVCTKFHRANPDALKNCIESDTILTKDVKPGKFRAYKCKNNLWDVASPIYIGDKHVGNIFTGQFFYKDDLPDKHLFVEQAKKYGFDQKEYLSALDKVPRWEKEKVDRLMVFFTRLAEIISRLSYSNIKLARSISEQKRTEKELQESGNKLDFAMESGNIGVWEWSKKTNRLVLDRRMKKIFGLPNDSSDKTFAILEKHIIDEDLPHVQMVFNKALNEQTPFETVSRIRLDNGEIKYINIKALVNKDSDGSSTGLTGVCFDITEMKKGVEMALFKLNEELLRSNKELQQFAYVASHDLQEPLRMITSFTQLLALRYKDQLDQDAKEFIQYAVDGALRMQNLINALLSYSRIQTKGKVFSDADMNEALDTALMNLDAAIRKKDVQITADKLPTVKADEGQMVHLFQNFIGNAVKFCTVKPEIHISASDDDDHYTFSVRDNGIGIEPQYFDRIFQIFQRLHTREEYNGTGIGLAICKRIVERHGGKIWVESKQNEGSCFFFTIPK